MAEDMRSKRPLSPHLTIYRPQMTSMSSILVRISGNALLVGFAMVVWWLLAAASSADYFAVADGFVQSWFGQFIILGSVWALWYHLLGGLRHLIWDQGKMLEIEQAEKLGWAAIVGSVVLTALTYVIV